MAEYIELKVRLAKTDNNEYLLNCENGTAILIGANTIYGEIHKYLHNRLECGLELPNESSGLHLQRVSNNEVAVCDCTEPNAEDNAGNKWCSKCKKMYHLAN